jgi:hypothetical protein
MAPSNHAIFRVAAHAFTGVRQRVILVALAAALAVITQRPPAEPPGGATGYLNTIVEMGGERFRLTCQGQGVATVVFLELPGTWPNSVWIRSQAWVSTFARVCVVFATSGSGRTAMLAPGLTDQIAGDLGDALDDSQVPAPYVIVATTALTPIAVSMVEGNAATINGGLILEPANDPVTGWLIDADGNQQAVTMADLEHLGNVIQSLF